MGPAAHGARRTATVLVERTRARVKEAVLELLQDEGLDAVTHLRVAQRSGVGRATLYRHWPTREELILDVFAGEEGPHEPPTTGDLRADVHAYLAAMQEGLREQRFGSVLTSLVGRADWDPVAAKLLSRLCDKGTRHLSALLAGGVAAGRVRPDVPLDDAVARFVGPIVFVRLVARREIDEAFVARLVDDVLRQLAPG